LYTRRTNEESKTHYWGRRGRGKGRTLEVSFPSTSFPSPEEEFTASLNFVPPSPRCHTLYIHSFLMGMTLKCGHFKINE